MDRRFFLGSLGASAVGLAASSPVLAQDRGRAVTQWEIGPVIRGRNYSVGMPPHPRNVSDGEWAFDFPGSRRSDGHVHALTRATGPLDRARGLRLRYRVDGTRDARIVPQEFPDREPLVTLFIQRRGDNWRADRTTQHYRWYSPPTSASVLRMGEGGETVMFEDNWKSVMTDNRHAAPREWLDSLRNAERIGFTFGSRGGRSHGVFATAPARFTLLDFSVI